MRLNPHDGAVIYSANDMREIQRVLNKHHAEARQKGQIATAAVVRDIASAVGVEIRTQDTLGG